MALEEIDIEDAIAIRTVAVTSDQAERLLVMLGILGSSIKQQMEQAQANSQAQAQANIQDCIRLHQQWPKGSEEIQPEGSARYADGADEGWPGSSAYCKMEHKSCVRKLEMIRARGATLCFQN